MWQTSSRGAQIVTDFQSFNKYPARAKIIKTFHTVTTFVSQEEVILEAAKMENWRAVNVSFWHKPQPPSGADKGI